MSHVTSERYYRRMSPLECLHQALAVHFPPYAIQLLIEADTLPAQSDFEAALALAATGHAGARLVPRGTSWFDSGLLPRVRAMLAVNADDICEQAWLWEPFARDGSPPLEIIFWPGTGILLRCSHALMDAGGLLLFAEEIFRALRGEPLLGASTTQSDHDYLKGLGHPTRRTRPTPDKPSPLGPPTSTQPGFVRARARVAGQVPAAAARIAAVLSGMTHRVQPGDSCRWMVPVDLRHTEQNLRSTGNFSSPLFIETAPGAPWTDAYAAILRAFSRHEERQTASLESLLPHLPAFLLSPALRWSHDRQVRRDRYLFSGVISHLGPVALATLSAPDFIPSGLSLLPFDTPAAGLSVVSLQHDHGLEIAISSPAATGGDGRLVRVLDEICSALAPQRRPLHAAPALQVTLKPAAVGASVTLPSTPNVFSLFAEQAMLHPTRTALSDGHRRFSYAELDRLSSACARLLRQRGVAANDTVAIISDRCAEAVIALLGILRLGAAYVAVDPETPTRRLRFILDDCRPACVVVQDRYADRTDFPVRVRLSEWAQIDGGDDAVEAPVATPRAAYVLYTSGSTGNPKGVMVGHHSLVNYLLWAKAFYRADFDTPVVFPFFTTLAVDLTVTSLLLPLITGGQVRVFDEPNALLALTAILADTEVNAIKLTPSQLRLLGGLGIGTGNLRRIIVGGENFPRELASEIAALSKGAADIFNEYGPTEATVGCIAHRFQAEHDTGHSVPIGLPIANTEIFLLDNTGEPTTAGAIGEIYLGGACLALGYVDHASDRDRFIALPSRPADRLYRTGDRARQRADGAFEFKGRLDDQVKILGYRVEIGDVEAAIAASGLCSAFAVTREDAAGGTRLAAFVTMRKGADIAQLRKALEQRLPRYMVPARLVELDQMPLNQTGKVDKALLTHAPADAATKEAPTDTIEATLLALLGEVPDCPDRPMDAQDSLLDAGLDSLQMLVLLTLAARRFLPAAQHERLFSNAHIFAEAPTIQNLAALLRSLGADQSVTSFKT